MLINNTAASWKTFGRTDPYYGVLNDDRYRSGKLAAEARLEFFRSGNERAAVERAAYADEQIRHARRASHLPRLRAVAGYG